MDKLYSCCPSRPMKCWRNFSFSSFFAIEVLNLSRFSVPFTVFLQFTIFYQATIKLINIAASSPSFVFCINKAAIVDSPNIFNTSFTYYLSKLLGNSVLCESLGARLTMAFLSPSYNFFKVDSLAMCTLCVRWESRVRPSNGRS